jgi:hypothetical protein
LSPPEGWANEFRLVASAWVASVAGVATFVLIIAGVFRPELVYWEGRSGWIMAGWIALVTGGATVVIAFVVVVLGMLSSTTVSAHVRRKRWWSAGLGALVAGFLALVVWYEVGGSVLVGTVLGAVAAISGAATGWVFWWLVLRTSRSVAGKAGARAFLHLPEESNRDGGDGG